VQKWKKAWCGGSQRLSGSARIQGTIMSVEVVHPLDLDPAHVADSVPGSAPQPWTQAKGFNQDIVKNVYANDIRPGNTRRLQLLLVTGYFENYLWKHYSDKHCTVEHTLSVTSLINIKCKDSKSFAVFDSIVAGGQDEKFELLFNNVVKLSVSDSIETKTECISFLVNVYQSIGTLAIRRCVLKYLSLPLWRNISAARLESEFSTNPTLRRHWQHQEENQPHQQPSKKKTKKAAAVAESSHDQLDDANWFPTLINSFLDTLQAADKTAEDMAEAISPATISYLEIFVELMNDLISQLPTRRFLVVLLDDFHLPLICKRSLLYSQGGQVVFARLVDIVDSYVHFQMDNQTGKAYSFSEVETFQVQRIHQLQKVGFELFPGLIGDLVYSSSGELGKASILRKYLQLLDEPQLVQFAERLGCLSERDKLRFADATRTTKADALDGGKSALHDFAMELVLDSYCERPSQVDLLNRMSLYPSEELLSDPSQVPYDVVQFSNRAFPFPKLNLQFLTLQDYLLRNFTLYRLEYAAKFRSDLIDIMRRLRPRQGVKGAQFAGWSRMALTLNGFSLDEVSGHLLAQCLVIYLAVM
jgi:intron-binding protein aquarius